MTPGLTDEAVLIPPPPPPSNPSLHPPHDPWLTGLTDEAVLQELLLRTAEAFDARESPEHRIYWLQRLGACRADALLNSGLIHVYSLETYGCVRLI